MPSLEQIVQKIVEKTGKSAEEIIGLVEAKKDKFSGLLTEEGAAFMIAREHNVELEQDQQDSLNTITKIKDLVDGMQGISLELRVNQVFSPKQFEKNGKQGKLCSMIVADDSGESRLTVWNNDVQKVEKIEKGDRIIAQNCYVKMFQEKPQLSLSYQGNLIKKEGGVDPALVPIKDLKENLNDVSVKGKIIAQQGIRSFQREGKEGHITAFELEDSTGSIRVAAWNELAEPAADLKTGDTIKIEGAYTKEGQNGLELHLGWRARIITAPIHKDGQSPTETRTSPKP